MRPMVLCKLQSLVEARILTTARGARRRAHSGERQHGAVRIPGSDSTALRPTHVHQHGTHGAVRTPQRIALRQQHGTHGAVRTPGSYSMAQHATVP